MPGSRLLGPRRSIADWFSFQMGTIEGWLPVEAQSKELPGVAILKLSPVVALSFSFRDRRLVNVSNILAPLFNGGWPKLGGNFRLDGQIWANVRSAPHAVPSPKVVTAGRSALGEIAGRKCCSVPDPAHRRLASRGGALPYFRGCRKIQRSLMPFPR